MPLIRLGRFTSKKGLPIKQARCKRLKTRARRDPGVRNPPVLFKDNECGNGEVIPQVVLLFSAHRRIDPALFGVPKCGRGRKCVRHRQGLELKGSLNRFRGTGAGRRERPVPKPRAKDELSGSKETVCRRTPVDT